MVGILVSSSSCMMVVRSIICIFFCWSDVFMLHLVIDSIFDLFVDGVCELGVIVVLLIVCFGEE